MLDRREFAPVTAAAFISMTSTYLSMMIIPEVPKFVKMAVCDLPTMF